MYDLIIIGAGPAGLTAALYGARSGKSVLVLEGETFGGAITLSPLVENYPATGSISGIAFADALIAQVTEQNVEIELGTVLEIRSGDVKTVVTEYGEYEGRSVIIATGAKHRKLGIENEEYLVGKGVSYCAVCDGAFYKDKDVAVVGGGNSALTDALYLSEMCRTVYLIHRRDTFRAENSLVEKVEEKDNIKLILNSQIVELKAETALEGLKIKNIDGEETYISVEALFVMIGREAQNSKFRNLLDLEDDGYIKAGEDCKTKVPGIYVAGDCRSKSIRQLTTAVADGTVAAMAACEYLMNN